MLQSKSLLLMTMALVFSTIAPAFADKPAGKGPPDDSNGKKDAFSLFGNATIVKAGSRPSKWGVELVSYDYQDVDEYYAGIGYETPEGLTVSDLEELSAVYEVTEGTLGGGSPRFSIGVDTDDDGDADGYLFVYLGTPPDYVDGPSGVVKSGNLLNGFVDASQFGGEFYGTWEEAVELVGEDSAVVSIDLVADGGWATEDGIQTVVVYEVQVNDDTFRPNGSDKKK
jgi:hypothetical protein